MEQKPPIGIVVRCLNNQIGRYVSAAAAKEFGDSATAVHGWVVRYLYDNRDRDVFQRDLENAVLGKELDKVIQANKNRVFDGHGAVIHQAVAKHSQNREKHYPCKQQTGR